MKKAALLIGLLVVLLTFGCGKQEQAEEQSAPEAAKVESPEKAVEPTEQSADKIADTVAETATEVAAGVEQKTAEVVDATTQAVEETATEATQAVEAVAEKGKEAAAAAATVVEEKAAAVAEAVAPAPVSEGTMVIENSYGKVTFSHKVHSEAFDCATCHGEGEPGALDMGKEKAHAACKGCHMEKAAGPIRCSDCHVK